MQARKADKISPARKPCVTDVLCNEEEEKARKQKLFALVRVRLTLGQPAC